MSEVSIYFCDQCGGPIEFAGTHWIHRGRRSRHPAFPSAIKGKDDPAIAEAVGKLQSRLDDLRGAELNKAHNSALEEAAQVADGVANESQRWEELATGESAQSAMKIRKACAQVIAAAIRALKSESRPAQSDTLLDAIHVAVNEAIGGKVAASEIPRVIRERLK